MKNIILGLGILLFVSCTSQIEKEGISVVTSLNPNYNLIKYIAQDKVTDHIPHDHNYVNHDHYDVHLPNLLNLHL